MGILKSARIATMIVAMSITSIIHAEVPVNYKASVIGTVGNGDFAPYYI